MAMAKCRGTMIPVVVMVLILGGSSLSWAEEQRDLGEIVVTAQRLPQEAGSVTSQVTVIGPEEITASSAGTVDELLRQQGGVLVSDNSTAKTAVVDIRGFGDTASRNVLILVNGRKVNPIDISGPDLLQIPLSSVEKVEVMRGSGSVLYGDNATGGVINIITKHGRGLPSARVGGFYGSYDSHGEDLEVAGRKKDLTYYLFSQYQDLGGYRENSDLLSKDFNARLGYQIAEGLKADLITSWHEDDYGLPGGLSGEELIRLGRRGSASDEDYASTKDRHVQFGLDLVPFADEQNGHLLSDFYYRNRDTYAFFKSYGDFGTKRKINDLGLNNKYQWQPSVGEYDLHMVTGVDYHQVDNPILGSGTNTDDLTISKDDIGVYGFGEVETLPDFYLKAGSRFQKAFYTFDQKSGTRTYEKQSPQKAVSLGGARYEYARGSNVFVDAQQTFRFLATDEWYDTFSGLNTSLRQQTGVQYQAGIKHDFQGLVSVGVTPYRIDNKDEIFFDPKGGSFGFGSNGNYPKTRRDGIELEGRADLRKICELSAVSRLEWFNHYTYQKPEFRGGAYIGKTIPLVPVHMADSGIEVGLWERYNVSLVGRYVGPRFAINDTLNSAAPIKPYVTMDGKISVVLKPMDVFFSVNNIFDRKYFTYVVKSASSDNQDYFPAPGRSFTCGAHVAF